MANLSGKVALVTGAGQGVGQGIAFALAQAGVVVAVAGRTEAKIADTAKTIATRGGQALVITCDVFKAEDITRTVARTVRVPRRHRHSGEQRLRRCLRATAVAR